MAWYMMAAAIINDLAGRVVLPLGKPWIARQSEPAHLAASSATPGAHPASGHKAA
jgi:hypothetical protein